VNSTGLTRLPMVSRLPIPNLSSTGIPWRYPRAGLQLRWSSFCPDRLCLPSRTSHFRPRAIASVGEDIRPCHCGRTNPLTMTWIVLTGLPCSYCAIILPTYDLTSIELRSPSETTTSGRIPPDCLKVSELCVTGRWTSPCPGETP